MASDSNGNQWYQPTPGLGHVGAYQASGIPWATSSVGLNQTPTEVSFPYVTKFITIKNTTANNMRVGFSQAGVNGTNYFLLGNLETVTLDLRVTKLYLRSDTAATSASVVAGLTGITSDHLANSWSGSAGVG